MQEECRKHAKEVPESILLAYQMGRQSGSRDGADRDHFIGSVASR